MTVFADYPKTHEDATAEALMRNIAVLAQASSARTDALGSDVLADDPDPVKVQQYGRYINTATYGFALIHLFRVLSSINVALADEAAQFIWRCWDAADPVDDYLWEWATELGIDAEKVRAAALGTPSTS